jgi:TonB family protein
MTMLALYNFRKPMPAMPVPVEAAEARPERVYLPTREELRRLAPAVPRRAAPVPPPPKTAKDRISVGAPDPRRAEKLILERDKDISSQAPAPGSRAERTATPPPPAESREARNEPSALPLPMGRGSLAAGDREASAKTRTQSPILSSLAGIERRIQEGKGMDGVTDGATGQQMGALFFDPQGADFTAWINHFKNEVYRNWIMPQAAMMGFRGVVEIEFVVERNGTLRALRLLSPSGTSALDRAAQNALLGGRFMPLPADFGPPEVTMKVSFHYN